MQLLGHPWLQLLPHQHSQTQLTAALSEFKVTPPHAPDSLSKHTNGHNAMPCFCRLTCRLTNLDVSPLLLRI